MATPLSVFKDAETTPANPHSRAIIPITETGLTTKPLPKSPKSKVTVPATDTRKTSGYAVFRLVKHDVPPSGKDCVGAIGVQLSNWNGVNLGMTTKSAM